MRLHNFLFNGLGIGKDLMRVAEHYNLTTDQCHTDGQSKHVVCLEHGSCIEKDLPKATGYCKVAAGQCRV